MNEELKIIISAETSKAKSAMKEVNKALDDISEASKKASSDIDSLTSKCSKQSEELRDLKKKYVDVAAAQGENSDEAKALAKQIEKLSGDYLNNSKRMEELANKADSFDKVSQSIKKAAEEQKRFSEAQKQAAKAAKEVEAAQKKAAKEAVAAQKKLVEAQEKAAKATEGAAKKAAEKAAREAEKAAKKAAKEAEKAAKDIEKAAEKAARETEKEAKEAAKKAKKEIDDFKGAFEKIGDGAKKVMKTVVGSIAAVGGALLGLGAATKDYREGQAKLTTAFEAAGSSAETAKQTYNDLYRVLGEDDVSVEAANHLSQLTTNQKDLGEWTKICEGVYATFGDSLPIEGLTEAANETVKTGKVTGSLADALNWAGISEDDFNKKLASCNTEAEKEKLVRETLGGIYDEAAEKYEKNAEDVLNQNDAQRKLNDTLGEIGKTMAPINQMLTDLASEVLKELAPKIQDFVDKHGPDIKNILEKIAEFVGKVIGFLVDNWETVIAIAGIIIGISTAISVLNAVLTIYTAIMTPHIVLIALIVAGIVLLVAAIVLLITHWDKVKEAISKAVDKIKEKAIELRDKVKEKITELVDKVKEKVIELKDKVKEKITEMVDKVKEKVKGVKDKLTKPFKDARDKIKEIVDKIKGFFNFKIEFPKIKLPHFSIKPKGWKIGDLLEGSIPKLGIDWYAKGGVFEKPTAFGMNGGNMMVGGEAGAEAIVPLEKNTEWLDKIADKLAAKQGATPIILEVDGKTFAQTSISSINQLTKQTGKLGLKLS